MIISYPKANTLLGVLEDSKWGKIQAPIYQVSSANALNQLVGYIKFINGGNGTVLYRGQNDDYNSLVPSGCRRNSIVVSENVISNICADEALLKFFQLRDPEIDGWKKYQGVVVESVLQHYGAKTFCMDFVDNHWCALWFGIHKFHGGLYELRDDVNNYMYLYMYLADTNGACVRGVYIGEKTYTIDLRKAVPSCFLRPASQHGWIVRNKERKACDYDDEVVCVAKIKVQDAIRWVGKGELLSQSNFFPDYENDQGYSVLLQRQIRSGIASQTIKPKVLPLQTIENYHYRLSFYCENNICESLKPIYSIHSKDKRPINGLQEIYELLLHYGWTQETCNDHFFEKWTEDNPCRGHSLLSAILVKQFFGGDIYFFRCSNWNHYFNRCSGCIVDIAYQEITPNLRNKYIESEQLANTPEKIKRLYKQHKRELETIIQNCGLIMPKSYYSECYPHKRKNSKPNNK